MRRKIKIFGAGSIGCHLANASRALDWDVTICDIDPEALRRFEHSLYPGRYGRWDSAIKLCHSEAQTRGGFDVIHIGTPPPSHLPLALKALEEAPAALLIEKPLCTPVLAGLRQLVGAARRRRTRILVGYDHVVGKPAAALRGIVSSGEIGKVLTIDVEFREDWSGILRAHPWLKSAQDSYLGSTEKGGGALGEHSHGLNMVQHLSRCFGLGEVRRVTAVSREVIQGGQSYDALSHVVVETESGAVCRVTQDVLSVPPAKRVLVLGEVGSVEWVLGGSKDGDVLRVARRDGRRHQRTVNRTRPEDFIWELQHVEDCIRKPRSQSPIDLKFGVATMRLIAACLRSAKSRRSATVRQPAGPMP